MGNSIPVCGKVAKKEQKPKEKESAPTNQKEKC
jgi:hypothetical protein